MSDEKRQAERVPIGLRVRLRFPDMDSFVAGYASNISRNGVFLEGVAARPVDTLVRFELLLADGSVAMRGEGKVIWSREGADAGLALRFTRLDSRSKALIDDLVARARVSAGSIPPPPGATQGRVPRAPRVPLASLPVAARPIGSPPVESLSNPPGPMGTATPAPLATAPIVVRLRAEGARVGRPSLLELEEELVSLERETLDQVTASPAAPVGQRASLVELERDLEALAAELGVAVEPVPTPIEPVVPPRREPSLPPPLPSAALRTRSIAPVLAPGDDDDLPAVLGFLGDDGAVHSPIEARAPSVRAPIESDATPPDAGPAVMEEPEPEPMREPTPVPSEPPEEIDPEDEDEEEITSVSAIPPAPAMPSADVTASMGLPDELPNLDLAMPEEPTALEPVEPQTPSAEPPKRRSLLGKLLGR